MKAKARRGVHRRVYASIQKKSLRNMILRELVLNFGYSDKLKIAEVLVDTIMGLFDSYVRGGDKMEPYDLLWLGVDREERPSHGKRMEDTLQRVVRVRLWTEGELRMLAEGELSFKEVTGLRMIRIAREAAGEGVLLNPTDLGLIVGREVGTVRRVIREYEKEKGEPVPIRSRVHDMGSHQTHKGMIMKMHLEGLLTSEIARITGHDPENVDRYIQNFRRVMDLARRGMGERKICFITGMSKKVVREYLEFIEGNGLISKGSNEPEG